MNWVIKPPSYCLDFTDYENDLGEEILPNTLIWKKKKNINGENSMGETSQTTHVIEM